MSYAVRWRASAERDLQSLPRDVQSRLVTRIEALAGNPRPPGSRSLQGDMAGLRRLRVGNYRIAQIVDDVALTVGIVALGYRSRFYGDLRRTGP